MATASSSAIGKVSKEEWRRQKDLEAARKAGTAPAEVDEEGRAINPHIPQFMAQAPWYMDTGRPSLKHQKAPSYNDSAEKLKDRYQRGVAGPAATKYRKGACENCGALTHKKADCLERPRKVGAKWSGRDIVADEILQPNNVTQDWDAKRDLWDGFDTANYKKTVEEYEALEEARRKLREEEIDKTTDLKDVKKVARAGKGAKKRAEDDFGSSDESEDDDDLKYADGANAVGQKLDAKTRVTVRNLRIREDTAKYLRNLDIGSAYYDPKTRSMRDAPDKSVLPEDAKFAGDNFLRHSGNVTDVQKLQLFAWQSESRGNDVHINANPTQGELLHREHLKAKEKNQEKIKMSVLDRYGGAEYLEKVPKELLGGQTENYVEYSRTGQVVKGLEKAKAKSKYDEDVYPGNHSSIWGSYYNPMGQWAFACCHSTIKTSYCVGRLGVENEQAASRNGGVGLLTGPDGGMNSLKALDKDDGDGQAGKGKRKADDSRDAEGQRLLKKRAGEGDPKLDKGKLAEALKNEEERLRKADIEADDRSRKFNGLSTAREVTDEDMEAYRMKRKDAYNDPMANYQDTV